MQLLTISNYKQKIENKMGKFKNKENEIAITLQQKS